MVLKRCAGLYGLRAGYWLASVVTRARSPRLALSGPLLAGLFLCESAGACGLLAILRLRGN
jgi:hypothetical protein